VKRTYSSGSTSRTSVVVSLLLPPLAPSSRFLVLPPQQATRPTLTRRCRSISLTRLFSCLLSFSLLVPCSSRVSHAVADLDRLISSSLCTLSSLSYSTYLSPGSPSEINISSIIRSDISSLMPRILAAANRRKAAYANANAQAAASSDGLVRLGSSGRGAEPVRSMASQLPAVLRLYEQAQRYIFRGLVIEHVPKVCPFDPLYSLNHSLQSLTCILIPHPIASDSSPNQTTLPNSFASSTLGLPLPPTPALLLSTPTSPPPRLPRHLIKADLRPLLERPATGAASSSTLCRSRWARSTHRQDTRARVADQECRVGGSDWVADACVEALLVGFHQVDSVLGPFLLSSALICFLFFISTPFVLFLSTTTITKTVLFDPYAPHALFLFTCLLDRLSRSHIASALLAFLLTRLLVACFLFSHGLPLLSIEPSRKGTEGRVSEC
jgi:hypothetical protein